MRTVPRRVALAALVLSLTVGTSACRDRESDALAALHAILETEDTRPADESGRATLLEGRASSDPATRAFAVRALGRLEDPSLLAAIRPALDDPDANVRGEAAGAMAQAVHGTDGTPALAPLLEAAAQESDPVVRGELARSLGRIRPGGSAPEGVLDVVTPWVGAPNLAVETAVGVALGLEGLSRGAGAAASDPRLYEVLDRLASFGVASAPSAAAAPVMSTGLAPAGTPAADDEGAAARVRSLAVLALGQRGRLSVTTLRAALADADEGVRASGARFLRVASDEAERVALAVAAVGDADPIVRIEAVRAVAGGARDGTTCALLFDVARNDESAAVRSVALDALADPCPADAGVPIVDHLALVAAELPAASGAAAERLPATRALLALARTAPDRAGPLIPAHVAHPDAFVRAHAAAVADVLADTVSLRALTSDPVPNVRTAALPGLRRLLGSRADSLLVTQLASDDPWLLLTASELLAATTGDPAVASAALDALERTSAPYRDTSRDPRLALLGLVRAVGDASFAPRLEALLADPDPVVASAAAEALEVWTGVRPEVRPSPAPRLPLPTLAELRDLEAVEVVLHMADGGAVVVWPLPRLAPTNAHRFVRLARSGHFDGLTFHRWVPNFVIQGGSPAANEYAGDASFTRDEIGRLSHWRGTVGLSTRGRDTGDGQIFVNLVHNVRLDHDYTVFGVVVEGLETVDRVLEGDVILRAEVRPRD